MFGLFKNKHINIKKNSALNNQKPRKRRSRNSGGATIQAPTSRLAVKVSALLLALVCAWALATKSRDRIQLWYDRAVAAFAIPVPQWEIVITDKEGAPLSEELRKEIYRLAVKALHSGSAAELSSLASAVDSLGSLENVTVLRPRLQTVVVSAVTRTPVMYVQVETGGPVRYLTSDAAVYGDASRELLEAAASPANQQQVDMLTLSGIFENRSPRGSVFQYDRSQRLLISHEERELLLAGLSLAQQAKRHSLDVKAMNYQGYRGFALSFQDGTEVILGHAPFEYKLEKLLGILGKLKSQGHTAARIELDYDGKAFIKERKL